MPLRSVVVASLVVLGLAGASGAGDEIRLNQIQVVGTHNSYHIAPHPNVMGLVGMVVRGREAGLDYTHRPLPEQFDRLGIRQVELDLFADPEGGHYAEPSARKVLKGMGKEPGPAVDARAREPGLKVFHIQDIDYRSTAPTFVAALMQIRDWSLAHPRHVPILVLVEPKDDPLPGLATLPVPFDGPGLDAIDAEIRSVFDRAHVLAPDDVRGTSATLPDAIRSRGWPTLSSCRGKVMFALDDEGKLRDLYLDGHPGLRGRLLFASVPRDHPAAAWMKRNDPVADFDDIRALVRDGFLVRTRADADTKQARKNDATQRDKALASGAQFVSTDYPEPRPEFSPYCVKLPGGVVARSNPVNGPASSADIEK